MLYIVFYGISNNFFKKKVKFQAVLQRDINEDMNIAVVIAIKQLQEFQVLQRVSVLPECLFDNFLSSLRRYPGL